MKLTDLNPGFVGAGGEGITNAKTGEPVPERHGVGISFECPCGGGEKVFLHFRNPLDGGESVGADHPSWERTGEDFESLTLTPSIQRRGGCNWHGFLTDGVFKAC